MQASFARLIEGLHPKYEELMRMPPCSWGRLPKTIPMQGVLFLAKTTVYVGRSNGIRARFGRHCNPGATHRMAAFGFKLAREATGKTRASYKAGEDSRTGLMLNAEFREAFETAEARIRKMDFRCVEETDQNAQALLEYFARSPSMRNTTTSTRTEVAQELSSTAQAGNLHQVPDSESSRAIRPRIPLTTISICECSS